MIAACDAACRKARVLHWPLIFPEVFQKGGFDCILTNPPWDMLQISEEEFFAPRDSRIAELTGAKRKSAIASLERDNPSLYRAFNNAVQWQNRVNAFIGGSERFPLSAVGKLNLYSVISEVVLHVRRSTGTAGMVVPTGICTDSSNKSLFSELVKARAFVSLYDFENAASGKKLFEAVDSRFKFCLLTLGPSVSADFAFFLGSPSDLAQEQRHFSLSTEDFTLINPNTRTAPIFRSKADAELAKKIYSRVGVLVDETQSGSNPWGVSFRQGLFNMTSASDCFEDVPRVGTLPLYEAKLIHQFDSRWATYEDDGSVRDVRVDEKRDPNYSVVPHYWVDAGLVKDKFGGAQPDYLIGWRDVTNATNQRTVIASVIPVCGVGNNFDLISTSKSAKLNACLLGDFNSFAHDWCARQKIGGMHLNFFVVTQIATLAPTAYTQSDIDFIVPRVLELTYTSHSLKGWAEALGYEGEPFVFDPERRAVLRAELDARYAKLYGLNEQELTYILDPSAVYGPDYPSESFRVLKEKEIAEFGEYRTMRMVLEAWKAQETNIAVSERYKRNAESWDQERSTYLRLLVGQMVAQSPTHSIPIEDLFGAFSALRTPKVMSELEQMPVVVKEWVTQYKDFVRDDESLDNVLAEMFDAEEISISKTGIVSFVDEGGLHAADSLRDVVIDASLSLAFWKLVKSSALVSRCRNELPLVFWQKIAEGYYARTA